MLTLASKATAVFQPDERVEWMSKSVAFQKVIEDRMFFSGESSKGRWNIGVADCRGGAFEEPRLVDLKADGSFYETIAPSVVRAPDRYVLVFAGQRHRLDGRRIFMGTSRTLDGPWEVQGLTYSPSRSWEGRAIDLGPGSFMEDGEAMFFYSSSFPSVRQIAAGFARAPHIPTPLNLMRYERRGIGILRVRVTEPHALQGSESPLRLIHASGPPPESVFCPGYVALGRRHLFFAACSNYSHGYPFEQWIGVVESDGPPSKWSGAREIRPIVASESLPPQYAKSAALDSPDPVRVGGGGLRLYFSAMSRDVGRWSIMACDIAAGGELVVA